MGTRKILISFALPEEMPDFTASESVRVITTRVGKANAAYKLTKNIVDFKPDIVVNAGTSGTVKWNVGDIVVARRFYDRDLAPLTIEGVVSEIEVGEALHIPSILENREAFGDFTVNTGDDFVTDLSNVAGDVIDMEGFAQAMVCKEENIPFVSVKYITDIIGQNSVKVWNEKLADARKALGDYFNKYVFPLVLR